jgi:hypothetical protein
MAKTDDELTRVIEYLQDLWDDGASSRKKDAFHPYHAAVLSEYRDHRKRGAAPGESRRMVELAKVKNGEKLRRSIRRIIAATSNADDRAAIGLTYQHDGNWFDFSRLNEG